MEKFCGKCKMKKQISEFGKNKSNKDGVSDRCKECERQRSKEYRLKNPEKQKESSKRWRLKNPEKQKEIYKSYIEKNPHMASTIRSRERRKDIEYNKKINERRRQFYIKNAVKLREKRKEYYYNNKKEERKRNNRWKVNKLKTDPVFRCKKNIRDRIRQYMKGKQISKRTFDIIGLTQEEFKKYVESMFLCGMSWNNYGEWDIDHITPLCTAKTEEEIINLNFYTNLRPMWHNDNIKRNRKYDY
jgi:hypothetical protein